MTPEERQLWQGIQRHVQARPDGLPGVETARAITRALGLIPAPVSTPTPAPASALSRAAARWPVDRRSDMQSFYGEPGSGLTAITPPYPLSYDGRVVARITVHQKIAHAVHAALSRVLAHYGAARIRELRLDEYDGCFNNRPKRGGTSLSTHAYGAALDFCAAENPLRADHRTALFARPEYVPWFEAWETEGAVSLGRARDFDWMHVQFARLA